MRAIDDSAMISRYLLQDVTPEEQEEIERRYFSDPEYLTLIEAVEGDLMDAYVRRQLSHAQRVRFEEKFLCTRERRERLKIVEAMHRHMPRPKRDRPLLFVVAATLIVLVALAAWCVAIFF